MQFETFAIAILIDRFIQTLVKCFISRLRHADAMFFTTKIRKLCLHYALMFNPDLDLIFFDLLTERFCSLQNTPPHKI